MTKTLTEQWREGTLEDGFYYIKKNLCGIKDIKTEELFSGEFCTVPNEYIEEVLGPVPDYEKVKEMSQKIERLEFDNEVLDNKLKELATKNDTLAMGNGRLKERLEIATKALKEYADEENWRTATTTINTDYFEYKGSMYDLKDNGFEEAQKALKEMEGVK